MEIIWLRLLIFLNFLLPVAECIKFYRSKFYGGIVDIEIGRVLNLVLRQECFNIVVIP